jgi:AraC family transcriptional regulator
MNTQTRAPLAPGRFYGDTLAFPIADAVLSEVRHERGGTVPYHTHEAAFCSLLLDGSYHETAANKTIEYEPFTVVFHAPMMEHTDTIGPAGGRFFMVELLRPWIHVIESLANVPTHLFELHGEEAAWLMLRLYHEFLSRAIASTLTVESLLFELCTHIATYGNEDREEPGWLGEVDVLVQERFSQHLSLRAIASEIGVHPSHLARAFRRFRGRTIGDCAVGLRTQLACRRLTESDWSLAQIANEAGFSDQSHMTRVFKGLTGVAPGAYRRRASARPG